MTTEKLRALLAEGEGFTIEFKECVNSLNNSVFESVCSFSNRYGGYILLGVTDDGEVLGVNPKSVSDMKKNFINMLNNPQKISPTLMLNLSEIEIDGKIILYVYVPVGSQVEMCSGRLFDRNGDSDNDITNSGELAAQLISQKSGQFTERKLFPYATMDDMRLDLIPKAKRLALSRNEKHLWEHLSDMEFFRSAGLYEDDKMTGKKGFNLAGVLLFGKDEVIQSCAAGAVTDCLLRRENLDRYDDRLIVATNLIEAFDQIFGFIEKHTLDRFFLIGTQSVSVRSHIAREIVSNLLVHREYSSSYRSRLIIEQDRIVTDNWSRPQFEGHIDPFDFTPHSKNPILAKFFVNIGRADELGSGVRNLYKYTKIYTGGAEPELIEGNVFKTIVPLVNVNGQVLDQTKKVLDQTKKNENLSVTDLAIIEYLKLNPSASQKEIATEIGKSLNTVKACTTKLQLLGTLKREGGKKGGRWVVVE